MSVGSGVGGSVAGRVSAGTGVAEGTGVPVEIVGGFVGMEGEEQEEIRNNKRNDDKSIRAVKGWCMNRILTDMGCMGFPYLTEKPPVRFLRGRFRL
jgi:hypothetical protein